MAEKHEVEFKVADGIKIGSDDGPYTFDLLRAEDTQRVWMWDIGPEKPEQPPEPSAPQAKFGSSDRLKQEVEYKLAMETYEKEVRAYRVAQADYDFWNKKYGGPYMEPMWSVNANDALRYDALAIEEKRQTRRRWFVSSRTRGYRDRANQGLPDGFSPGRFHEQMLARERAGESDAIAARRADPVFGLEMAK